MQPLDPEQPLSDLVHDLRQSLSNIATSVAVLELLLSGAPPAIEEHLRTIGKQVEFAARTLDGAASRTRGTHPQRTAEGNLAFTKSHTAALT